MTPKETVKTNQRYICLASGHLVWRTTAPPAGLNTVGGGKLISLAISGTTGHMCYTHNSISTYNTLEWFSGFYNTIYTSLQYSLIEVFIFHTYIDMEYTKGCKIYRDLPAVLHFRVTVHEAGLSTFKNLV